MTVSSTAKIHPSAIIEDGATIGAGCSVGPYAVVGPNVSLGKDCRIDAHVALAGRTTIGRGTRIFPFASIGQEPQDLKYNGEDTALEIGEDVSIREHVTINIGTEGGGGLTKLGDRCLLMVGTHIGHDCMIGSNVIFANNATIAGHVEIGDFVVCGGLAAIHQFCRVGPHSMIGGMTGVEKDVIPYGTVMGNRASLAGLNLVGMKRRGFDREAINGLRAAYRTVFEGEGASLADRAEQAKADFPSSGPAREVIDFICVGGSRRFCTPDA